MSYSDLLKPRPEVLSEEGIYGIIDLQNALEGKKKKLEADPDRFLSLTYPTADVRRVIQKLNDRFSGKGDTPGLFLFEGLKGSGKSHLLLMIYHLFKNYDQAKAWLDAHHLLCNLPSGMEIIINKFTDLPLYSIWDFISEKLAKKRFVNKIVHPGLDDVKKVIGDKRLILILDELEQGIRVISNDSLKDQNIAFLQMLSEWSNRSDQITIFASIYSDQEEPGSTLKRVSNHRVQFAHAPDRINVVLHRLFKNYMEFDKEKCSPVIDSYINVWKRNGIQVSEAFRSEMLAAYPFQPDLLDLILEKVPARGGFQSVRGALGFLAHLVRLTHQRTDLITAAHAEIGDREISTRLSDLDTSGDLINRANSNLKDLRDYKYATDLASTVMLYTLTGIGRDLGTTREEIMKHILTPASDVNELEKSLMAFQRYAPNFHVREGRYFFDLEENADAKVEYQSLKVDKNEAIIFLRKLWKDDIFMEPNAVVLHDIEDAKDEIDRLDKKRLRYILSSTRLSQDERHELFYGLEYRNQVILLEPKDPEFYVDTNRDLLKWASRQIAARALADSAKDSSSKNEYSRISDEDKAHCINTIKRAGLVFIHWERYGGSAKEDQVEEEVIPAHSKDQVLQYLREQLYPPLRFEEHLLDHIEELIKRRVSEINNDYKSMIGYPIPTVPNAIANALRSLCRSGKISIKHPRNNYCGSYPQLSDSEIQDAIIDEPFEITRDEEKPIEVGKGKDIDIRRPTEPGKPGESVKTLKEEDIKLLPQRDIESLRREVAVKLQEHPDAKVTRIMVRIFLDQSVGDLSTLPSAFRGSMSGQGSLTADLTIVKDGEFAKADVEKNMELLPSYPNAEYSAELKLVIQEEVESNDKIDN